MGLRAYGSGCGFRDLEIWGCRDVGISGFRLEGFRDLGFRVHGIGLKVGLRVWVLVFSQYVLQNTSANLHKCGEEGLEDMTGLSKGDCRARPV